MIDDSLLNNYAFTYKYRGLDYSFAVVAESKEEAVERVAVMSSAEYFGCMVKANVKWTPKCPFTGILVKTTIRVMP